MAREMTPQERAAAVKHVVYMFGVPEFEVEGGEYENALAATVTLQRDTRRAALLEAAQRADLGDCNSLLDAPCLWCGYNGEGYWQPTTHDLACPWHNVGGRFDRVVALDRLAQEG